MIGSHDSIEMNKIISPALSIWRWQIFIHYLVIILVYKKLIHHSLGGGGHFTAFIDKAVRHNRM